MSVTVRATYGPAHNHVDKAVASHSIAPTAHKVAPQWRDTPRSWPSCCTTRWCTPSRRGVHREWMLCVSSPPGTGCTEPLGLHCRVCAQGCRHTAHRQVLASSYLTVWATSWFRIDQFFIMMKLQFVNVIITLHKVTLMSWTLYIIILLFCNRKKKKIMAKLEIKFYSFQFVVIAFKASLSFRKAVYILYVIYVLLLLSFINDY